MTQPSAPSGAEVKSYLTLRKAIGIIGILLPIVLVIGIWFLERNFPTIQSSISSYYHTAMGDVLVGSLCAVGVFLWSYKGYVRDPARLGGFPITDNLVSNIAGISAVCVALFPTAPGPDATTLKEFVSVNADLIGGIHVVSAAVFFTSLAVMSIWLFARGASAADRRFYQMCGAVIFICMAAIFLVWLLPDDHPLKPYAVFWLEAVAIWAFGFSWFKKGRGFEGVHHLYSMGRSYLTPRRTEA